MSQGREFLTLAVPVTGYRRRGFFTTGPADQLVPAVILRYLAALKDRLRAVLRPTNCSFRLRVADEKHGFQSRTGFGIQTCFGLLAA